MFTLEHNYNIQHLNSFGISVLTESYFSFTKTEELIHFFQTHQPSKFFILGGGSNLLFTQNYNGTLIHPQNSEINIVGKDENHTYIEADAGVEWDKFVEYCVENSFHGIENLSLIPGNVGASPVQNIGAYGVEAKDVIFKVNGYHLEKKELVSYTNNECQFDYRDSIFKNGLKNKIIITSVVFRLNNKANYLLEYGSIKEDIEKLGEINLINIRKVIINTRNAKLPDPEEIGNAGSFFKNPVVTSQEAKQLLASFPNAPYYKLEDGNYKIPAGWLIEQCGWKGKRAGNAGVHPKQALVLINKGGASGDEILELANMIKKSVSEKFNIELEKEVITL